MTFLCKNGREASTQGHRDFGAVINEFLRVCEKSYFKVTQNLLKCQPVLLEA